ncbi:hypothetical protein BD769DRAFT_1673635 [Suillus cothurnatus]|nr:hypothetical protein BD769DRAFT_1673635 [Suillus cothurnatus]
MDQHMAMQSAEGLSHDHSFKVTGILGKVNGVAMFGALHTASLAEIPVMLAKYGHAPVKVVFIDNVCGDKSALEQAFPSLLHDVSPVPSSTLDDLALPDGWHDESVCVSTRWDDPELSSEQETYAALDVYAAWAIYKAFLTIPSIGPITPSTPAGIQVQLMSHVSGLVVAYGYVAHHQPKQFDGVNVTKTQIVVTIISITVPAYLALDICQAPPPAHQPIETLYHMSELNTVDSGEPSLMTEDGLDASLSSEQATSDAEKDAHGVCQADSLAELISCAISIEVSEIHSRVIGNIWHLMNQFKISLHHGLQRPFSFKKVKQLVPPPETLAPHVAEVLQIYGPLKDAVTGQPLFNDSSWEKACAIIENIKMGYYSDPPSYSFYALIRTDKYGLNVYRCSCGTNNVEGRIHQNIIRCFGSFNASPRLTVNLLCYYTLTHNLEVGSMNCMRRPYLEPSYQDLGLATWLNGDEFEPARESLAEYAKGCKIKHNYLARQQQILVAVLPIHTIKEKALYWLLLKNNTGQFSGKKQPNWITLAQEWQHHTNRTSIFYKLPEHLKSYFKIWNEHQNEHNSLLAVSVGMPEITLAQHKTVTDQILSSAQPAASDELSDWQIGVILSCSSSQQTLLQLQYNSPTPAGPHRQKRPAEESMAPVHVKQHAQHTCKWCCKADCLGKFRSWPCKYKPSNGNGQQLLDSLQHNTPRHLAQQSAPQHPDTLVTGLSAPFSVQNVAPTRNVPYTFFYSPAAFNMGRNSVVAVPPAPNHMSDNTIRVSTSAQASTSSQTSYSPSNHTNAMMDPKNGIVGGGQGGR